VFKSGTQLGSCFVLSPIGRGKPDGLFEIEDKSRNVFAMRAPIGDLNDEDEGTGRSVSQRFLPDVQSLSKLRHLNLVPMFEPIVEKGYVCLVYERVRGRTLAEALSLDRFPPPVALMITRQILEGCAAAHAQGRIHRNLSPRKILLQPMEGWDLVKVADMGLGTLRDEAVLEYGAGALTGSVRVPLATYMAPEQVRERSVDARTDFYAIGCMLFEMLAGRPPFPDRDLEHVKMQQLSFPPPKLTEICSGEGWVSSAIQHLVDTSLKKEREERFSSTAEMIAATDAAFKSIT
jgi:serine/threonine protein kinase